MIKCSYEVTDWCHVMIRDQTTPFINPNARTANGRKCVTIDIEAGHARADQRTATHVTQGQGIETTTSNIINVATILATRIVVITNTWIR